MRARWRRLPPVPKLSRPPRRFLRVTRRATTPQGSLARHGTVRTARGPTNMATVIHEAPDQSGSSVAVIAVIAIVVIGFLVLMFFFFNGYMGGPQVINMMQPAPVQGTPGTPGMPGAAGAPGAGGAGGAGGAAGAPGPRARTRRRPEPTLGDLV